MQFNLKPLNFRHLALAFWLLCFCVPSFAQRGARADIGTLSTNDQNTLAMHVDQWLTEHDDLPDFHNTNFNLGIHWSSNFLPWHRIHIRELEYFLNDEMGWPGLLPGWRPKSTAAEPNNIIPVPFRLTYWGANGTVNNNPIVSLPANNLPPGACAFTDVADFSDEVEEDGTQGGSGYHNRGHGAVDGIMGDGNSPAVLIFWPWHAWVDELWYKWEASCAGEYTKFDLSDNIITINGPDEWAGEHFVKGEVVIESGGVLTIPAGAIIHFRDSDYESYATRIRVKPGGRLVVAGKLTGIDDFGNEGNSGGGSVHYYTGWEGVVVEGTGVKGGNHGRVVLQNNSVVEHAKKGVLSTAGGKVIATGANFKNCRTGIEIRDYLHTDALYLISGCKFSNDKPLRDVTWESAPIGNQKVTVNFRHTVSENTDNHIRIDNAYRVRVMGCTFTKEYTDFPFTTRGIYATGASLFSCSGGSFTSLFRGIESNNPAPGPLGNPSITGVTFTDNATAILLYGSDYANVTGNTINLGTTTTHQGIAAKASSSFNISGNTFTGAGSDAIDGQRAVLVESPGTPLNTFNTIDRNTFTGSPVQIQFQKSLPNVFFTCNNFNGFQRAVALSSGSVANQGTCELNPAGNLWDNFGCMGDESQLFKNAIAAAPYIYTSHSDRTPTCVSAGIFLVPCPYSYEERPSCEVEPPCDPPCKLTELGDLDLAKKQVANGTLSSTEKEAQITALQTQQKIVAQEGLSAAMATDSTLAAAFAFMNAADDFIAFTPAEKIGLNLLAGNLVAATNEVNALPAGNEKTLWELNLTLQTQGRPFALLTAAETQTVEAIAQGTDLSAAHAEAILASMQGKMLSVLAEPLDNSNEGRPSENREKTAWSQNNLAQLNCQPNPSSGAITVSYTLPSGCKEALFVMADMYGRIVYSNPLEVGNTSGQIGVPGSELPVGTYFGLLIADGKKMAQSKISIVR